MARSVGRNDPCPCGSGKKYKQCCMKLQRAATSRRAVMGNEHTELMTQLYEFSQQPAFNADITAAFVLFWNDSRAPAAASALDAADMVRFFDWYTTDYQIGEGRKRIIELFAEEAGSKLRPPQAELLHSRERAAISAYKVLEVESGQRLTLQDVLRSGEWSVDDGLWSQISHAGDLLVARLLHLKDDPRLSPAAVLLPPQAEEGLRRYVQEKFEHFHDEYAGSGWDEFLRDHGYLFNHYLLSEEAESWQDTVGSGAPYYSARGVRSRMKAAIEELDRKTAAQTPPEEPKSPILTPADVARERSQRETPKENYVTSEGGILLPGQPEPEEQKQRPSILVPGRDA